jgi:hypothetical protein
MKAIAKCPKCRKILKTDCRACIENGEAIHDCKGKDNTKITENIKWKLVPETEDELNELEDL